MVAVGKFSQKVTFMFCEPNKLGKPETVAYFAKSAEIRVTTY